MKEITLTQGKIALVDDEDYEWLSQWKWTLLKSVSKGVTHYYGRRRGDKALLHRMIMKTPPLLEVDHKDRNGLNNQKYNLRNCTRSQNMANQVLSYSKTKGIYTNKNGTIRSVITVNKEHIHLGYFTSVEEAVIAYNNVALHYFGEYARLNIIGDHHE